MALPPTHCPTCGTRTEPGETTINGRYCSHFCKAIAWGNQGSPHVGSR